MKMLICSTISSIKNYLREKELTVSVRAHHLAFASIALVILGVTVTLKKLTPPQNVRDIQTLEMFVPFTFSDQLNPKQIFTVGDQVVSEHIFALHVRQSMKDGLHPIFSSVDFQNFDDRYVLTVTPKHEVIQSDGKKISLDTICKELTKSFQGAHHTPYSTLLLESRCYTNKIELHLKNIPANIKYLLTLPDFAIVEPTRLPLKASSIHPTTGPYYVKEMTSEKVTMKINNHYPKELRANEIENVNINRFSSETVNKLVDNLNAAENHFIYFFGYDITNNQIERLKEKKYVIEQYPNEWLVFIGLKNTVPLSDRLLIGAALDNKRNEIMQATSFGEETYSISPASQEFGLTKNEYNNIVHSNVDAIHVANKQSLSRALEVSTLDSWYKIPFFKKTIDVLQHEFPNQISIKLYDRANIRKLFSEDAPATLTPLGISHFDPISHLSFLRNTLSGIDKIIKNEELAKISTTQNVNLFNNQIKEIESRLVKDRTIISLAHFPGIVVHSDFFERDENLAFAWGIQSWTYQIH